MLLTLRMKHIRTTEHEQERSQGCIRRGLALWNLNMDYQSEYVLLGPRVPSDDPTPWTARKRVQYPIRLIVIIDVCM